MENLARVTISEKGAKLLRGGHVWVYADEVLSVSGKYENGDLVNVFSEKGKYLGTGFINSISKIRVRIVSKNANDRFDTQFWERRVRYAIDYRRTVMQQDFSACRLIFGEADSFPGLTVDRFGDVLSVQVLSLGIEKIKNIIFELIVKYLTEIGKKINYIYERNDVAIRELEGLKQYTSYYPLPGLSCSGSGNTVIEENSIKYNVDYICGQKTGFFLDQKYNRLAVARIARGKTVLDCFTHTGAFALNAAKAGAAHVTAVDISKDAVETARLNARLNGLEDKIEFVRADVFDLLDNLRTAGHPVYDFIILDPPAFTKSRDTLRNAIKGYREINTKAMKLLPRGGYLATCSCSHFMTETYFKQMLHNSAEDAGVSLRQIEARQQSPDHPILWNVPETDYLKFFIFQIV